MKNKIPVLYLFILSSFYITAVYAIDLFGDGNDENQIWGTGLNQYIKLANIESKEYGLNSHPVQLDAEEIVNALEALEFNEETFLGLTEELKPVFTIRQTRVLGESFSLGLNKAKPDQDLIFVLERNESKLLGLKDRSFMTGRAFYKDGKLNIIIGDYEYFRSDAFEKTYDPSGRGNVPYNFNFGSRLRSSRSFEGSAMVDMPGIENKQVNEFRYDWFVIDVNLASDAYLAKKSGKNKSNETYDSKALELEAAKMAKQRREMRAEMARMRKEMQNNNENGASVKTIEERIATLDQLRDKNLITEDEYNSKREAILNDI